MIFNFCTRHPWDQRMFWKIWTSDIEIDPKSIYVHIFWPTPDPALSNFVKNHQKSWKSQHFADFSKLLRHGPSRNATERSQICKIVIFEWCLLFAIQLRGSRMRTQISAAFMQFQSNDFRSRHHPTKSNGVKWGPVPIECPYLVRHFYHFWTPSALTLYIKFTISKVWIFQILNKINLGSSVVVSRSKRTDFRGFLITRLSINSRNS